MLHGAWWCALRCAVVRFILGNLLECFGWLLRERLLRRGRWACTRPTVRFMESQLPSHRVCAAGLLACDLQQGACLAQDAVAVCG